MQSSFNIYKSSSISEKGEVVIATNDETILSNNFFYENKNEDLEEVYFEKNIFINLGEKIINNARIKASEILNKANTEASEITEKAYKDGYKIGEIKGNECGFQEGYIKGLTKGEEEIKIYVNEMTEKTEQIYLKSLEETEKYLKLKNNEIIELIASIIENLLEREFENIEVVADLLKTHITKLTNEKNFVVRINTQQIEKFRSEIERIKKESAVKGEIIILEDPLIENNETILVTSSSKIKIDCKDLVSQIKEVFKSECKE